MNWLIYSLFFSIFLLDFFHYTVGIAPRQVTWMPELLSIYASLIVALHFAKNDSIFLQRKYVYLILLYLIVTLIGSVLFSISGKQVFFGVRVHLKHLPFFLLPAVCAFSLKEIRAQLKVILFFLLLQCPVAIVQKVYFSLKGKYSGDFVGGTVLFSGVLSITLICGAAVVFALYLKKMLTRRQFFIVMGLLLFPTMINETKASLVLTPIAFFVPALFCEGYVTSARTRNIMTTGLVLILFLSAFVPVYNYFIAPVEKAPDLAGFVQDKEHMTKYLYKGVEGKSYQDVRRLDSIALAFKTISEDSLTAVFGVGLGSVTKSYFGSSNDERFNKAQQYKAEMTTVTHLLWESGVLGVTVYVLFFVFLFQDARLVMNSKDLFGAVGLGWCAVVIIIGICLVYINILHENVINLIFWYFCGLVAAKACRMKAISRQYALVPLDPFKAANLPPLTREKHKWNA